MSEDKRLVWVELTLACKVGLNHVLNNMDQVSLEQAQHMRDVRKTFMLLTLPEASLAEINSSKATTSYLIERGRLEWLLTCLTGAFGKQVKGVFSDCVLDAYDAVRQALAPDTAIASRPPSEPLDGALPFPKPAAS